MGLFKKNPAEKKLKELTGGLVLKSEFVSHLEKNDLKMKDGINIQRTLKDEIKQGLSADQVENRLNTLINECKKEKGLSSSFKICPNCNSEQEKENSFCTDCGYKFNQTKDCPMCNTSQDDSNIYCINCGHEFSKKHLGNVKQKTERIDSLKSIDFKRKTIFLSNYDFNIKTCPECNTKFLKTDPFCFNCGASVITADTVKNKNLKVKDGKLVSSIEEPKNKELSDLEQLYNQTVQSKYVPSFKVAYILYLDAFSRNPTKSFPDKTAKKYETTSKKLQKQAIEDGFIEPAPAITEAQKLKVSDLKEILKAHNLKVSGKKDELIERLSKNLSEDELKKYFKSKNYQISDNGLEFLSKNSYILYIYDNNDISRVFNPSDIGKIFKEQEYSQDEIQDIILEYLKNAFDEKLNNEIWVDFKSYANAIAAVLEDKNELKEALNLRFKVFLFDINNYSVVIDKPDPTRTKLKQKDVSKLNKLLHKLTLPIDELKELFETSYNETLFKMAISKEDSLVYLLRIFGGEDLDEISSEINENYSNPY